MLTVREWGILQKKSLRLYAAWRQEATMCEQPRTALILLFFDPSCVPYNYCDFTGSVI
jgi:hypothetical protein